MIISYRYLLLLSVAVAAAIPAGRLSPACAAGDDRSALERDPAGWKDLLPSERLDGWTRLPIPPTGQLGKQQWSVDAAARLLTCAGDGGHEWLRYDREVGDCIFHVEWRFVPVEGSPRYNSGVFVRNSADGSIWHQAQVGGGSGGFLFGDTLVAGEKKRVNLSGELKEKRVRAAGEWNTYEITCKGTRITVWVNGAAVSEFASCEVPRGYVGLEAEGYRIQFRNLKVKELS
jgi:hypothetical protein